MSFMFITTYYYSAPFHLFESFTPLCRYFEQRNVAVIKDLFNVTVLYRSKHIRNIRLKSPLIH